MGFTFDLVRSEDPKWGTIENGQWNGLMKELVTKQTDMVLSALRVNAEREAAVDFTIPYLESGIAILVAKRTGIISPTAFLEPFDIASWMLVTLVAIQASALSIFLFEWLSPSGYNMKVVPAKPGRQFSLFRTYWLVCAVLFQAAVKVDCPRGLTARFMSGIWALFAVVFLALYTANLAAFMIPRKEYHNLGGLDDPKINNPQSQKPTLKFGTIPYSYTEMTIQRHFPEMFSHLKKYSLYNTTDDAVAAVKEGKLDAFIYDGTVLNYLAYQDEECRLLQVGSWSAMTGYALAFPVHSKYKAMFNEKILELRENGDLERLSRFWLSGMCKPNVQEKRASESLSIAQFLSAFLLLGGGTVISLIFLCIEHLYMRYLQDHVDKGNRSAKGCFSLLSQSIGQNYSKEYSGKNKDENHELNVVNKRRLEEGIGNGDCQSRVVCDAQLQRMASELLDAKLKVSLLEHVLSTGRRRKRDQLEGLGERPKSLLNLCPVALTPPQTNFENAENIEVVSSLNVHRHHERNENCPGFLASLEDEEYEFEEPASPHKFILINGEKKFREMETVL